MRKVIGSVAMLTALVMCGSSSLVIAQSTQAKTDDTTTIEYYYKAKWGYADEFFRLFKKNHLPVLKKELETGSVVQITITRPRYHNTEDGRWDYRVTIVFRNTSPPGAPSEQAIIKQLFPDQDAYQREEQHRFEILLAHWDVPIVNVPSD
jgi:hypothetical protein